MYIYNVTINIDDSIQVDWLRWMQEKHIPEMLATGKFTEAKLCQVMVDEESGITYSIQYTTDSKETLERYYNEDAQKLRKEMGQLFPNKFVSFRTELDVLYHTKTFIPS